MERVLRTVSSSIRGAQVWSLWQIGSRPLRQPRSGRWVLDLNGQVGDVIDLGDGFPYGLHVVNPIKGPFQVLIRLYEGDGSETIFYDKLFSVKYTRRSLVRKGARKLTATLLKVLEE